MTFYDGQEDNYDIIKGFEVSKYNIEINYLFHDLPTNLKYSKQLEDDLTKQMIEQALKRDEESFNNIKKEVGIYFTEMLLSLLSLIFCLEGKLQFLFCVSFIAGAVASMHLIESYEKLKEMKKFRLYYSLKEELDKPENNDITKIIEFESFYREPRINIGNLDKFSYGDVKRIKKELKRRNNITGKVQRV